MFPIFLGTCNPHTWNRRSGSLDGGGGRAEADQIGSGHFVTFNIRGRVAVCSNASGPNDLLWSADTLEWHPTRSWQNNQRTNRKIDNHALS